MVQPGGMYTVLKHFSTIFATSGEWWGCLGEDNRLCGDRINTCYPCFTFMGFVVLVHLVAHKVIFTERFKVHNIEQMERMAWRWGAVYVFGSVDKGFSLFVELGNRHLPFTCIGWLLTYHPDASPIWVASWHRIQLLLARCILNCLFRPLSGQLTKWVHNSQSS